MPSLKKLSSFFIVCLLSGCSYFYGDNQVIMNRDTDYLSAKSIPPLKIPPGMSSKTISAEYPVSEREYPASTVKPDLTPPYLNG